MGAASVWRVILDTNESTPKESHPTISFVLPQLMSSIMPNDVSPTLSDVNRMPAPDCQSCLGTDYQHLDHYSFDLRGGVLSFCHVKPETLDRLG